MLWDHIRSAVRGLRRHRAHAVINVGGLAIGLAATFAILVFIAHETSYDRHHERADRIYRIAVERVQPHAVIRSAATPRPLAAALEAQIPEVERSTRLSRERAEQVLLRHGSESFFEDRFFFADSSVFEVFSLPLVRGNPATALAAPFSLVVAEHAAERIFGSDDPTGRSVVVRLRGDGDYFEYRVTGVARDLPETSHFRFDFLASYEDHPNVGEAEDQNNWAGLHLYTYLLLRPGSDASQVASKIPAIVRPNLGAQVEENLGLTLHAFEEAGNRFEYFLQPLADIHLHSGLQNEIEAGGDATYVYAFAIIAAFILGLACINFTHLATARSISRMKEVGVRKVLGARRSELIRQFLVEALLSASVAAVLALAFLWMGDAVFVEPLTARPIEGPVIMSPLWVAVMAAAPLIAGLAAGIVPAMMMSRCMPSVALRGGVQIKGGFGPLRGGLVIFQFAVSGVLIACTLVMERQMGFLHQAELGFDEQHVVVIDGTEVVAERMHAFQQRVASIEGVVDVTNAQSVPGQPLGEMIVRNAEMPSEALVSASWMTVGTAYATALGIEVIAGRDLSADFPTDSTAVLLNASAASALGFDADAVGGTIVAEGREYLVVGVVEDYHFASLHERVGPLVIFGPDPWNRARPNFVVPVRVRPDDLGGTLAALERTWKDFVPGQPFVYSFLDEEFGRLYRAEARTRLLFRVFSLLAIVIACLGLFGLTAFATQRRRKEIGVRKVLGASVSSLVNTLSRRFVALVIIGLAVASPVAYLVMDRWLATFAYRVALGPAAFLLAAAVVLLIASSTIAFHVVRSSLANPVENLRYE